MGIGRAPLSRRAKQICGAACAGVPGVLEADHLARTERGPRFRQVPSLRFQIIPSLGNKPARDRRTIQFCHLGFQLIFRPSYISSLRGNSVRARDNRPRPDNDGSTGCRHWL